jgi:hypothetical protein
MSIVRFSKATPTPAGLRRVLRRARDAVALNIDINHGIIEIVH